MQKENIKFKRDGIQINNIKIPGDWVYYNYPEIDIKFFFIKSSLLDAVLSNVLNIKKVKINERRSFCTINKKYEYWNEILKATISKYEYRIENFNKEIKESDGFYKEYLTEDMNVEKSLLEYIKKEFV